MYFFLASFNKSTTDTDTHTHTFTLKIENVSNYINENEPTTAKLE